MSGAQLAVSCADGKERVLTRPVSLELVSALDTPASSLLIRFLRGGQLSPVIGMTLSEDGRTLFSGECDQQNMEIAEGGRFLTLSGRSRAALLLDNEMPPQEFYNLTARRFFDSFLAPCGFAALRLPEGRRAAGTFRVPKGLSLWEAFTQLCWRLYAREPRVDRLGEITLLPPDTAVAAVLSNYAGIRALRYTSLEEIHRRASVISRAVLPDRAGAYASVVESPFGNAYRVSRTRYVSPAAEYRTAPSMDALQRMNEAQRAFHTVKAVLPGLRELYPGDRVRIRDTYLGGRTMAAWRVKRRLDARGAFTELILVDPIFV